MNPYPLQKSMAKYLLLAEKPSVSRAIQQVYGDHRSEFTDNFDFSAFHGHLMELAQPAFYDEKFKKWNEVDLPIIPQTFVYEESDPESCKRLMAMIQNGHYDALINACDAGREGEHIFYSFYEAHKLTLPVFRFWASDNTDITILKALKTLLPSLRFDGLRQASKFRAQLDWLTGINFSRAGSIRTHKKLNIGRVVSPTLKIIVDREREITNFVPKDFFEIQGKFKAAAGEYFGTMLVPPDNKITRFDQKADAEAAQKNLGKAGTIQSVESKKKSIKAPTLYSLLELQKDGSKYFGYAADKTLVIAQSLYEKKLTTYPRTESRFLPTNMVPEIIKHLKPLENTTLKPFVQAITQTRINQVTSNKDYVDNAKIEDHHAIIPTMDMPNFAALLPDEQNLYLLIGKRLVSIFMDPYVVENTTILTDVGGQLFKSTGKIEVDKGYSVLYASKSRDSILPPVKKGDAADLVATKLHEGQTVPPDRFNTATLLDAMQNAGNYVSSVESRKILKESAGLGTSATRAEMLKKLEATGMVSVKKTVYFPTPFGLSLIDTIGDRMICSPEMTANWEKKLKGLEDGSYQGDFAVEMKQYVTVETKDMLDNIINDLSAYDATEVGVCPKCGAAVIAGKNYYRCVQYKKEPNPCDFICGKEYLGAKISETEMKALLAGKQTAEKDMVTGKGVKFKSALKIEDGRVKPSFAIAAKRETEAPLNPEEIRDIKSLGSCPHCKTGKIYEGTEFFLCTNRNTSSCNWQIKKKIKSADVSSKDVKALLSGKETDSKSFIWANGKKGTAKLKLSGEDLKFHFD